MHLIQEISHVAYIIFKGSALAWLVAAIEWQGSFVADCSKPYNSTGPAPPSTGWSLSQGIATLRCFVLDGLQIFMHKT